MPLRRHAQALDRLYDRYNRREFVHPDPLEFVYRYDQPEDREIAGLIAALLAYGRVAQILRSVANVLERLGDRPAQFVRGASRQRIEQAVTGFRHRFQTEREMAALLLGVRSVLRRSGSLERCVTAGMTGQGRSVLPGLSELVGRLRAGGGASAGHLLSHPDDGSACKRLMLFLRWMVRCDAVDVGGWRKVHPSGLVVPLDVHMHRLGRRLGATTRRSPDLRTAQELTAAFARICPGDPVRYDFALTRLGIHPGCPSGEFERLFECKDNQDACAS